MERSIQDIARLAGTTSRALRHYGDVGLLEATRTLTGVLAGHSDDTKALEHSL